jgi:hypothetical protein
MKAASPAAGDPHDPEPIHDLMDVQLDVLAAIVPEPNGLAAAHPAHRVVERVHEHPTAELPVRDDIEADVELPTNGGPDGLVIQLGEPRPDPGSLLRKHRGVAGLVERLDGGLQRRWPEQRPNDLGPGGAPRRHGRSSSHLSPSTERAPR